MAEQVARGRTEGTAQCDPAKQVAWDRNGKEIRVGDRVRKVTGALSAYEGPVVDIFGNVVKVAATGAGSGDDSSHFELIPSPSPSSELEELVKTANAGLEALKTLKSKHVGDVEFTSLGT